MEKHAKGERRQDEPEKESKKDVVKYGDGTVPPDTLLGIQKYSLSRSGIRARQERGAFWASTSKPTSKAKPACVKAHYLKI